jgi:hypothetical protein
MADKPRHPVTRHSGVPSIGTEHNTAADASGGSFENPSAPASSANQAAMQNAKTQPQPT